MLRSTPLCVLSYLSTRNQQPPALSSLPRHNSPSPRMPLSLSSLIFVQNHNHKRAENCRVHKKITAASVSSFYYYYYYYCWTSFDKFKQWLQLLSLTVKGKTIAVDQAPSLSDIYGTLLRCPQYPSPTSVTSAISFLRQQIIAFSSPAYMTPVEVLSHQTLRWRWRTSILYNVLPSQHALDI